MVNRQVVLETVKRMLDSNIEESVIEKTLRDIGLSRKDIAEYIAEARKQAKTVPGISQAIIPEEKTLHEEIAEKTAERVRQQLLEKREEEELRETTLHSAIEEHGERIGELHESVSELHEKIGGISGKLSDPELLKQIAELNKRISDFQSQLSDLKALASANKTILEKILETNRKILDKL